MAYRIDFTEARYTNRSRRKWALRLFVVAAVVIVANGMHDVYVSYNLPTLNMRLAEYESAARPIEEMNAAWDVAAREYDSMLRYYRLLWAANPTNFLAVMSSGKSPRLPSGMRPRGWSLTTGGECRLDYAFTFDVGDKALQVEGMEAQLINAVTSVVQVADGKVEVAGVQHQNLLNVDSLAINVKFSLPNVRKFPAKEKTLVTCAEEIAGFRKKVQETKISESGDRNEPATAQAIMMKYLAMGRDKPDFPDMKKVIDVKGWFALADQFIMKHRIPGDDRERKKLKTIWNDVGDARSPWSWPWPKVVGRFRALDNETLVENIRELGKVADGVRNFRRYLERRHIDNLKKLEPLVEGYERNDIFNRPIIESDLKDRAAKAAGVPNVTCTFEQEPMANPPTLAQKDECFTFRWIRWKLSAGVSVGRDGGSSAGEVAADAPAPITVAKVADLAKRIVELGPGYALDGVKVQFAEEGKVSAVELTGLLPVKDVESIK